jgi:hypothetical protein
MIRLFNNIFAISIVTGSVALAQSVSAQHAVATITASATVLGNVDLIVMKDLEFEINSLLSTELNVNPQNNPYSGEIKIVGNPNGLVRVTYERQSILRHESGVSQLYFTYNLSGGPSVVQSESNLLTQNNQIRLSDQGVYYLWVGGRLTGIENIIPGNYDMQLTLELEYIQ